MLKLSNSFSLVEILVVLCCITTIIFGIISFQAYSAKDVKRLVLESNAAMLAHDLITRIQLNRYGKYINRDADNLYDDSICDHTTKCSPDMLALNDLVEWNNLLAIALPDGKGKVCFDSSYKKDFHCDNVFIPNDNINYAIKIEWSIDKNKAYYVASTTVNYNPWQEIIDCFKREEDFQTISEKILQVSSNNKAINESKDYENILYRLNDNIALSYQHRDFNANIANTICTVLCDFDMKYNKADLCNCNSALKQAKYLRV